MDTWTRAKMLTALVITMILCLVVAAPLISSLPMWVGAMGAVALAANVIDISCYFFLLPEPRFRSFRKRLRDKWPRDTSFEPLPEEIAVASFRTWIRLTVASFLATWIAGRFIATSIQADSGFGPSDIPALTGAVTATSALITAVCLGVSRVMRAFGAMEESRGKAYRERAQGAAEYLRAQEESLNAEMERLKAEVTRERIQLEELRRDMRAHPPTPPTPPPTQPSPRRTRPPQSG